MEIYREFRFDAAHRLSSLPESHRCSSLHGHSFTVIVFIEGEVDPERGWVRDFGDVKKICSTVIDQLDHSYLNSIPGLENPTSEHIAIWLWNRIKPVLPELKTIEVKETPGTGCRYSG